MDIVEWINNFIVRCFISIKDKQFENIYLLDNYKLSKFKANSRMKLFLILSNIYELKKQNIIATTREIYYKNIDIIHNKYEIDRILKKICNILKVDRSALNIESSQKGILFGELSVKMKNSSLVHYDGNKTSRIPDIHNLEDVTTNAKYILVVEKETIFNDIIEQKYPDIYGPLILVTAKGYPDMGTMKFIKFLIIKLKIDVYLLTDADPHGINIALCYIYGSKSNWPVNYNNESIKWIGIFPSEIVRFGVHEKDLKDVTSREMKILEKMVTDNRLKKDNRFLYEVENLLKMKIKAELESFSSLSPSYLTNIYLPTKIKL